MPNLEFDQFVGKDPEDRDPEDKDPEDVRKPDSAGNSMSGNDISARGIEVLEEIDGKLDLIIGILKNILIARKNVEKIFEEDTTMCQGDEEILSGPYRLPEGGDETTMALIEEIVRNPGKYCTMIEPSGTEKRV